MKSKHAVCLLCFVLAAASPAFSQAEETPKLEPVLRLDTGGHTSIIRKFAVTSDKKHLISCSDDKTIRVWDTQTKTEARKILGQIGEGAVGMILAIALSPDDEYLAVGGFFAQGHGIDDDKVGIIRIHDFQTGNLTRILKSHSDVVQDLSFII